MNEQRLSDEFERIKNAHKISLRRTAARVVLGASVMRVFQKGTKDSLFPFLSKIEIDPLKEIKNQDHFKLWFQRELSKLAKLINIGNYNNKRIQPGYKWGHGAKVLTLYVRELVLNSRYFYDHEVNRIQEWLYVPIDSIVINRLRKLDIALPFDRIKDIDTAEKFFDIQDKLHDAAKKIGVPKIWFDDNWGNRQ